MCLDVLLASGFRWASLPAMNASSTYPPPDTFLLELLDQLNLAFPCCLEKGQVHFKRLQDNPLRVALTDLNGVPHSEETPRVPLGHTDAEVLDHLNAIVGDLAHSVLQHGGVEIQEGYWDVFPDATHGGINAFLVEKGEEEIIRVKRTFDKSELSWLLFTPEFYNKLRPQLENATAKRERLAMKLEGVKDFKLDLSRGTLALQKNTETLSLDVQLMGSWLEETHGFLWGWANPNCPPQLSTAVSKFKEANAQPGLRLFYKPEIGGPEKMAHMLSEHAACEMGLDGVIKTPFQSENGPGFMYLAF